MTDFGDSCLRILLSSGHYRIMIIAHRSLFIVDSRIEGILLLGWVVACKV